MTLYPRSKMGLQTADVGTELVVFDGELYHQLNSTARLIFELCDGSRAFEDLHAEFQRYYPSVDPERIKADVDATVERLVAIGLVVLVEATAPGP
jgi:hypothetical protein